GMFQVIATNAAVAKSERERIDIVHELPRCVGCERQRTRSAPFWCYDPTPERRIKFSERRTARCGAEGRYRQPPSHRTGGIQKIGGGQSLTGRARNRSKSSQKAIRQI